MSVEVNVDTGHARGLPHSCRRCSGTTSEVTNAATEPIGINRPAITVCVILATLMQALDTTIANVALPHIQGSVSASQEQIAWVLTSYIVAAAIMTPPTGFLAGRFGQKRLFLVSVVGFTFASMLCGLAQSVVQIVLFRILQGVFGATLVPLSQIRADQHQPEGAAGLSHGVIRHGGDGRSRPRAGARRLADRELQLAMVSSTSTCPSAWSRSWHDRLSAGQRAQAGEKLDWFGFGTLSIAIAALQVLLDRGEQKDWFGSGEIWIEAIVAASAFYLFLVHTFTTHAPFVRPALFRDRNFLAGTIFIAIVGLTYYASLALQPPYLQNLMDYPVVTAGIVLGPRGVGTMIAMIMVGRLTGRLDTRVYWEPASASRRGPSTPRPAGRQTYRRPRLLLSA